MKVTVFFPCDIYDKYQAVHALMCSMGISPLEYGLRRETSCFCSSNASPNDRWMVTLEDPDEAQLTAFLDKNLEVMGTLASTLPIKEANNVAPFVAKQPELILS